MVVFRAVGFHEREQLPERGGRGLRREGLQHPLHLSLPPLPFFKRKRLCGFCACVYHFPCERKDSGAKWKAFSSSFCEEVPSIHSLWVWNFQSDYSLLLLPPPPPFFFILFFIY